MSPPRRALIVSLDNLGDLAFAGALAAPLAEVGWEVSLWCKDYAAALAPFIPGVSRVYASDPFWDRAPGRARGGAFRFLSTLAEVRRERCDAALLPNTRRNPALAARLAGASRRVGFDQRGARRWLTDALPPEDRGAPVVAQWARLLAPLGANPARAALRLRAPQAMASRRTELAARLGEGAVAVHPFAGDARRCAPPEFWREFLRRAGARRAFVFGEAAQARAFAAGLSGVEALTAQSIGAAGLGESLLALSACAAFAGHDSGPLHCALGLGVPALGLYLPGDWPRASPQGEGPWRALRRERPADADPAEAAALLGQLRR